MADQVPSCCDSRLDLLRKIVLQFQTLATGVPDSLLPTYTDDANDLYRKLLLTLALI